MHISDMVVDRGQNDIREWKIAEQLKSGVLKKRPNEEGFDGRGSRKTVTDEYKLGIVMKLAERTTSIRKFAKENNVWSSAIYDYRLEYMDGKLGPVDDDIVEKLKG